MIDSTQSILDERSQKVGDVTGTSTGFTDFDQITTGLHEDNLIIIAARPAMGRQHLPQYRSERGQEFR